MKNRRTRNEQRMEQENHYVGMETHKPSNRSSAAFKHDVRQIYGVKQCLTKWGVNLNGIIGAENKKQNLC